MLTQRQYDRQTGWCLACLDVHRRRIAVRTDQFRAAFQQTLHATSGNLQAPHIQQLCDMAQRLEITPDQAFELVRPEAWAYWRYTFDQIKAIGTLTPATQQRLTWLQQNLRLPPFMVAPAWQEWEHTQRLLNIRAGKLPTVQPSVMISSAEICHWDSGANYYKTLTNSVKMTSGRLIITNQKVRFVSETGGFDFSLSKIGSVELANASGIDLRLTRQQGNGFYEVPFADLLVEIVHVLLNQFHRQALYEQMSSRSIPQHIKGSVYQRDQGLCIQCRSREYLEFDHIIPISLGGATSADNLQILCRACNQKKSNRI